VTKTKSLTSKRFIASLFLTFLVLTLTGCWSNQDIDDLAIINVLGIDQNEAGEYVISAVIVNKNMNSFDENTSGNARKSSSLIKTATGLSIHEAMGTLSSTTSKRIYLGHVNNVIFGEKVALNKMEESLDYFRRENDFRPNIKILVTKGLAADIVKINPQLEANLGFSIRNIIDENRYAPTTMVKDISQFMKALSSNTVDPVTAEIGIANNIQQQQNKETPNNPSSTGKTNESNENVESDMAIKGTAVFKGGNLAGWLDERETRGLLWVQGEVDTGIVVVSCDEKESGNVTLGLGKSNSQLIPHISKDKIDMTVKIHVNAEIRNVTCPNLQMSSSQIERLNKKLEKLVKQEALHAIVKAKNQWQTDIFGFGEVLYRKDPKKWDQLSKQWRTSGLREMGVQVKVTSNISRYGLQEDPIKANESR
jgi:spore germination protein KC